MGALILSIVAFFGGLYLLWRRPNDKYAWQIGIPMLACTWFTHQIGWGVWGVLIGAVAGFQAIYLGDKRIEKEKAARRQQARIRAALRKQEQAETMARLEKREVIGESVCVASPSNKKNEDIVEVSHH